MAIPRPSNWVFWTVATLLSLAAFAVLLISWLLSGGLLGDPSRDEVARVPSPSGNIEAVLLETNGGATTSFGYEVYVVERGTQPSGSPAIFLYGAVRSENAYGANLRWPSPDSLTVEYLSAKSAKVNVQSQTVGNKVIRFDLRDGVTDTTAPAGGMLYNIRDRQ